MMLKKTLASVTALLMVISATACSSEQPATSGVSSEVGSSVSSESPNSSETNSVPQSGTEANLRMIWWGSQTRHEYTQAAIDVFEEKNPGVTISPEMVSWDGYWQKLATQSASQDLPDIIQQDYKYIVQYTKNDLILDMYPYVESGVLNLDDCPESGWIAGEVDGKLTALCIGINTLCTMINPDMLEAVGAEVPSLEWTYADYEALCQTLVDNSASLGIDYADDAVQAAGTERLQYAFRENDLWFFNQDGSESFGWDKDAGKSIIVDVLNQEKRYVENKYTAPLAVRDEVTQNGIESLPMVRGKSAMASGVWSNQILAVSNAADKKFEILTYPFQTAARHQYMKPSQFLSVATNSDYPEIAMKFVNDFTNDIDMNMELKAERGVPISTVVQESLAATYEEDSVNKQIFDFVSAVTPIADKIWVPEPKANGAIITLTSNMFKDVINNGIAAEDAFESFYSQAQIEFQMSSTT